MFNIQNTKNEKKKSHVYFKEDNIDAHFQIHHLSTVFFFFYSCEGKKNQLSSKIIQKT